MTVKELIRRLEKIENKELEVISIGYDEIGTITDVIINNEWYDTKNNNAQVTYCEIRINDFE